MTQEDIARKAGYQLHKTLKRIGPFNVAFHPQNASASISIIWTEGIKFGMHLAAQAISKNEIIPPLDLEEPSSSPEAVADSATNLPATGETDVPPTTSNNKNTEV